MEETPQTTSIPPDNPQIPKSTGYKIFPIPLIGLIMLVPTIAFVVYQFTQKKVEPPPAIPIPTPTSQLSLTPTPDETANWKIYTDTKYGFEFKYPQDWEVGDSEAGMSSSVIQQPQKNYFLEIGYISQEQLNVMGITYCAAYRENKPRCESKTYKNIHAIIDWGADNEDKNYASVEITNPNGGMVMLGLSPVNLETRSLLYKILSTFKFLEVPVKGQFCGGIAGIACPTGYTCQLDGNYPDAGGKCIISPPSARRY